MREELKHFAVPVVATLGVFAWWFYALTHVVHFPSSAHGRGAPNGNVQGFNVLLVLLLVAIWIAAFWLFSRASRRGSQ